ncbi:MAG: FecR domain-containing protein [Acholeplasmataceae bacterium]|nr:FecR domain-containing protein [Acholeplasmataceae bacterium]
MRRLFILSLIILTSLFLISFEVQAEEYDGDIAAGTYYGTLNTLKDSSTYGLAFPDPITLTFYKRGFTSETEFILRAELNGEYFESLDGLDLNTNSIVRWHPSTYAEYNLTAGDEPSFNFRWSSKEIGDHFISIASSTYFDSDAGDFKVYFRAELAVDEGFNVPQIKSVQEGRLSRIEEGEYYEGDGPYNPGGTTDPSEDPGDDPEPTCPNQIDTSNMLQVHAGVTYTKGDNIYFKNEDCTTGRIRKNQPFSTGDILTTGSGDTDFMEVSLGTGTEFSQVGGEPYFRMQRLSIFRVMPDEKDVRVRISKGKVMFRDMMSKVKELYSDDFIIETPSAVTSIRGTELYLDVQENGDTVIYLTHGTVDVTDNYGYTINLIAGQKVEVTMDTGIGFVDFISEDDYSSFEIYEIEEESNFVWGLILVLLIVSPIVIVFFVLRAIKRKLFGKKQKLENRT